MGFASDSAKILLRCPALHCEENYEILSTVTYQIIISLQDYDWKPFQSCFLYYWTFYLFRWQVFATELEFWLTRNFIGILDQFRTFFLFRLQVFAFESSTDRSIAFMKLQFYLESRQNSNSDRIGIPLELLNN